MHRLEQVNSFLRQTLAQIIAEKIEPPPGVFITVTKADCGADLQSAKIFVSVLPFAKAQEGLNHLVRQRPEIQRLLGPKMKTKFLPKLFFALDDSEETADKIYKALDSVK